MTIEQNIAKYLDDHSINKSSVARKMNMNLDIFYNIVNGKRKIRADEFYKFSKVVEKPMEFIAKYDSFQSEK